MLRQWSGLLANWLPTLEDLLRRRSPQLSGSVFEKCQSCSRGIELQAADKPDCRFGSQALTLRNGLKTTAAISKLVAISRQRTALDAAAHF